MNGTTRDPCGWVCTKNRAFYCQGGCQNMANKKSSHSAPEKRKSGNNLTTVREQAAPRRVQYFAESLTEKRWTLVSQKLLKFFWTLTLAHSQENTTSGLPSKPWRVEKPVEWRHWCYISYIITIWTQNHREWLNWLPCGKAGDETSTFKMSHWSLIIMFSNHKHLYENTVKKSGLIKH